MIVLSTAGIAIVLAAQLQRATVEIDLSDTSATVTAQYQITGGEGSVRFVLMRIDGQMIRMPESGPRFIDREGTVEFTAEAPAAGPLTVRLQFQVSGDVRRIPLFVPSAPTDPENSAVEILVRGYPSLELVGDAFPRFVVDGSAIVARPENLPSFVLLPPSDGLSANRVADGFVILLFMLATLMWGWGWRHLRSRGGSGMD